VTVVGHAAAIAAGEWITASGEWVNDRTHGQQFKAQFLRTSAPTSADDLTKARPLTRQADRPILAHWFARTNAHVLFHKDKDGDENFNLWCVGIDGSAARNLTPYRDVLASRQSGPARMPRRLARAR
jgi:hypothetical protein